jgi:hypothetical protein
VLHGDAAFVIVPSVKNVANLIAPPPDRRKGVPARAWLPTYRRAGTSAL